MPKGTRILIVEGNSALRNDLKGLLRLAGYKVGAATDGRDALAYLANRTVDAIISGLELPNMKGDMLRELLRLHPSTLRLPFIMIGSGTPPSVDGDIAYAFLKKPIILDELISGIDKLTRRHAVSAHPIE